MEENDGAKNRARSNSARVLVFEDPKCSGSQRKTGLRALSAPVPEPVNSSSSSPKKPQSGLFTTLIVYFVLKCNNLISHPFS